MNKTRAAILDAVLPLLIPAQGITRGQLAKAARISYSQACQVLERMRHHRLVRRHLRRSQYIYRLTASRSTLTVGASNRISLN